MINGTADAFARAEPISAAMGKAVAHAGAPGSGQTAKTPSRQAAKIVNNMLLGATMVATCQAFLLAMLLDLDLPTFHDISSKASGRNWSMTSCCPVPGVGPETPADRSYQGGFATALTLKDLKLAIGAAHDVGASVPMGAAAEALYKARTNGDHGSLDFSAIIRMLDGPDGG